MFFISPAALNNSLKMWAIMKYWEGEQCHVDNTPQYLFIMLFKIGIDTLVQSNFTYTMYTSFMNVCSYSVFLAGIAVFQALTVGWFLGNVSVCFVLAHASFMYAALHYLYRCWYWDFSTICLSFATLPTKEHNAVDCRTVS